MIYYRKESNFTSNGDAVTQLRVMAMRGATPNDRSDAEVFRVSRTSLAECDKVLADWVAREELVVLSPAELSDHVEANRESQDVAA